MWNGLRVAYRGLWRTKSFAAIAVLTLTLGMGASTAVFSVVNTVLLRPLPFAEPDRLVVLRESKLPQLPSFSIAPGNFMSWRAGNDSFERMAAIEGVGLNLTGSGEPETLPAARVSADLFVMLGIRPVIGRFFTADDDRPGAEGVVVLSEALWRGRFGGEPRVLGRVLTLSGRPYTVVGVAPGSLNVVSGDTVGVWVPIALGADLSTVHGSHFLRAVGQLKRGSGLEAARADLERVALRLEAEFPDSNQGWRVLVTPLHDYLVRNVQSALTMLGGAVALVLLVVCANVASLMLARGVSRQKELAVRSALGAERGRLVREQLLEGLALAIAAGPMGMLVAWALLRGILALAPPVMPGTAAIGLDGQALAFGLLLTCVLPVVFGLLPALQLSRTDLRDSLSASGRQLQPAMRARTRAALVISQLALALVLLVGSSLLVRSFARLLDVDPGFDASNGLVVRIQLPPQRYPEPAQRVEFGRRLLAQLATLPGVSAVGLTQSLPLVSDYVTGIEFEGRAPVDPTTAPTTNFYAVSPGFFEAMGIRLVRGRGIEDRDRAGAPRVVVINESLARRYFPGVDPIGQRMKVAQDSPDFREIVGIVADTKQYGLAADTSAQSYESFEQHGFSGTEIVIRGAVDAASFGGPIRAAVHQLDPDQPVGRMMPIGQLLDPSLGPPRFSLALVGTFAGIGLLLAATSLYGLVAYTVRQRTSEIGVRMALGARGGDVVWLVVRQALVLAAAGVSVGAAAAYGAARLMRAMLFETSPGDAATFVLMPIALLAVVVLASSLPARRATRIDPASTLRGD